MFLRLLLLFTLVPLLELWLLVEIGRRIGFLPTLAIVLATGILGAALARQQGLQTIARVRAEAAAGGLPAEPLLDGLLILIAAAVLLTPGIVTDAVGFALLVPATRRHVRRRLGSWLRRRLGSRTAVRQVIVIEPEKPPS